MSLVEIIFLVMAFLILYTTATIVCFNRARMTIEECNKSIREDPEKIKNMISGLLKSTPDHGQRFETDGMIIVDKLETLTEKSIPEIIPCIEAFIKKVCDLGICDKKIKDEITKACARLATVPQKPKSERSYKLLRILTLTFLIDWIDKKIFPSKSR